MGKPSPLNKDGVSSVHNDQIWKEYVTREMACQRRKWPENWGYLIEEYKSMNRQLMCLKDHKRPTSNREGHSGSPDLKLPPIHPAHPKAGFPKTAMQQIGWKSSRKECSLELYGGYGPGNKSWGTKGILKRLKWPVESLE